MPKVFSVEVCRINDKKGFIVRTPNPKDLLVTTEWDKVTSFILED